MHYSKRLFRYDTPHWSHFGYGEGWAYGKCNRCLEHVYTTKTAGTEAVNYWKVLMFEDAVTDFGAVQSYLVERAEKDRSILGKWQRSKKSLAVACATSEKARDELKASIYRDLKERQLLKKDFLPYRRDCKQFKTYLGPWREWKVGKGKPSSYTDTLKVGDFAEE